MVKKRFIGKCKFCGEDIYSNQKYTVIPYALDNNNKLIEGPVHNKCSTKALKRLTEDLIREVETLKWVITKTRKGV